MRRGRSATEKTRHIDIRYFWVKERVERGEAVVEHLRTEEMFANILTQPLQGSQFTRERAMLTGWAEAEVVESEPYGHESPGCTSQTVPPAPLLLTTSSRFPLYLTCSAPLPCHLGLRSFLCATCHLTMTCLTAIAFFVGLL